MCQNKREPSTSNASTRIELIQQNIALEMPTPRAGDPTWTVIIILKTYARRKKHEIATMKTTKGTPSTRAIYTLSMVEVHAPTRKLHSF